MIRTISRWFAALTIALVSAPLLAQDAPPADFDHNFGNDGLAPIPQAIGAAPGQFPIGFVHLPVSGNYLQFSVQLINGTPRIVSHRALENGANDPSFGNNGSWIYALPVPDGALSGGSEAVHARVLVGLHNGAEIVYLIYKFSTTHLAAARITANGTLIDFASSNLPFQFAHGVGRIFDAIAVPNLVNSTNGVVIVVQGRDVPGQIGEVDRMALVKLHGGTFLNADSISFTRLNLRVNRILLGGNGTLDVLGTAADKAFYVQYHIAANTLGQDRYFDLSCGTSTATQSVVDEAVRENFSLGTDTIVFGRALCSGNVQRVVAARISNIEVNPTVTDTLVLENDFGACTNTTDHCGVAMAQFSAGHSLRIYATTPAGNLAFVDIPHNVGPLRLGGRHALQANFGGQTYFVLPTRTYGVHQGYPWLTGIAFQPSGQTFGMGRVILSALLSNGFE